MSAPEATVEGQRELPSLELGGGLRAGAHEGCHWHRGRKGWPGAGERRRSQRGAQGGGAGARRAEPGHPGGLGEYISRQREVGNASSQSGWALKLPTELVTRAEVTGEPTEPSGWAGAGQGVGGSKWSQQTGLLLRRRQKRGGRPRALSSGDHLLFETREVARAEDWDRTGPGAAAGL